MLLIASSCEKPSKAESPSNNESSAKDQLKQRFVSLNATELEKVIGNFKKRSLNSTVAKLSEDSLEADSAIWLLEATLNFDFDYNTATVNDSTAPHLYDTLSIELPYNSSTNMVSGDDLETIYEGATSDLIDELGLVNKYFAIDVEVAETTADVVKLDLLVVKYNPYGRVVCGVDGTVFCISTSLASAIGCTNAALPDAGIHLNVRLNCVKPDCGTYTSSYWTNLTGYSTVPVGNPYVYDSGYLSNAAWCNTTMSGTTLSHWITQAWNYSWNYAPTGYLPYTKYAFYTQPSYYLGTKVAWPLKVAWGVLVCTNSTRPVH